MPGIDEITIKENDSNKTSPIDLSVSELDYLESPLFHPNNQRTFEVLRETRGGKYYISNTSYAGIIQLPSKKRITFSTKVGANLFYILSFLKKEPRFLCDLDIAIDIKEGKYFFDVIGRLFANEMSDLLETGLLKKYVKKHENLNFLRGKLDIKKQLHNSISGRPKFACFYDDLTFDNQENRIILCALNNLIPLIKFNNKLRDELIAMEYLLRDFVSLVHISPQECDTVTFNRLNSRYQGIIRFSKIVLEEKYIRSTEKGESKGFNFIVNMYKVYEDFVTTMIEELIDEENEFNGYIVEKQKRFDSLVEEKEIISKPDVILKKRDSAGVYPLIIDAKYKRESSNSDYYQIIAYSLAIPTATSCCLVYPQTEKVDNKILHILTDLREDPQKSRKVKLHSLTIDLDRDLEFSEFTKEIKSDLKTKLLSCLQA